MKQTENYIWNSFLNSGKKHLILTGTHRAGKTTRFQALCNYLKEAGEPLPGITTYAVPGKEVLLKDNENGQEMKIGVFDPEMKGSPMRTVKEGFSELGCPALYRMAETKGSWVSIDELGFLESNELSFQAAVRNVFDKKRVLAVLRKQDISFLNELKERNDVYLVDLDQLHRKVGCVIMASGKSVRFGDNKLFAELNGKTFLQRALELTEGIFVKRVVVTRDADAAEYCRAKDVDVIFHDLPFRSDTVRIGTEFMEDMDGIVFCACDQPMLRRESLLKLRNAFSFEQKELLRLAVKEKQGMPALFGKKYIDELKNLPEGKGGSYILKKHENELECIQVEDPLELFDVDTKEDLEILKKSAIFL
ncbi:MAG: NTP transferase domain-containing protein [Anaerotignum sp.]|nr:NTP transferase domain-containing protein [Anaerotignum sp.]